MIEPTNSFNRVLIEIITRLTPRCKAITRLLSESMDRRLPWHQRALIRFHYVMCVWCERYGHQLHDIRRLSKGVPEREREMCCEALPAESRERIRQALRSDS